MLNLITGSPGSGKTLYIVNELSKIKDRTIYYDGIADISLPWIEIDAHDWVKIPDGSILVIDEVQRIWGTRDPKKPVPEDIRALETHRHRGIDIWIATQHPMMLDHHVRRLVGHHLHLRRNFGLPSSLLLTANEVIDDPQYPGPAVQRSQFVFPTGSYGLYKSAEIHTHKFRPTLKMLAIVAVVCVALFAIYRGFRVFDNWGKNETPSAAAAVGGGETGKPGVAAPVAPVATTFLSSLIPEHPAVPQSAPKYIDADKVSQVPYLSGCIEIQDQFTGEWNCNCYTQTGTRLFLDYATCKEHLSNLPFQYWHDPKSNDQASKTINVNESHSQPELIPFVGNSSQTPQDPQP